MSHIEICKRVKEILPLVILEIDFLTEQIEKLLKGRCDLPIAEELLLGELTGSLVENAKFEPGDQGVFVVSGYQSTSARAHDRHQRAHVQRLVDRLREKYFSISKTRKRLRKSEARSFLCFITPLYLSPLCSVFSLPLAFPCDNDHARNRERER